MYPLLKLFHTLKVSKPTYYLLLYLTGSPSEDVENRDYLPTLRLKGCSAEALENHRDSKTTLENQNFVRDIKKFKKVCIESTKFEHWNSSLTGSVIESHDFSKYQIQLFSIK